MLSVTPKGRFATTSSLAIAVLMALSFSAPGSAVAGEPERHVSPEEFAELAAAAEGEPTAYEKLAAYAERVGSPGVYLRTDGSMLVRVPTGAADSEAFRTGVLSQFGVPFDTVPSIYTQADFAALTKLISSEYERLKSGGHSLGFTYYPESDSLVLTSGLGREELSEILERFPLAVHENVDVVGQSRHNDTSPFKGGAAIYSNGQLCSSGYRVTNGAGTQRMVTAGHCFATTGQTVRSTSTGAVWGTVAQRSSSQDSATINGSFSSVIYTGNSTSTTTLPVLGAAAPVAGQSICRSARSGNRCGNTVGGSSYQCYSGVCATVFAYTGGTLGLNGDSGGAMYTTFTSGSGLRARIHGIHAAIGGSTMYGVSYTTIRDTLTAYVYNY